MFECPLCGKSFGTKRSIMEHWDLELAELARAYHRSWKEDYWKAKKKEAEKGLSDE